MARAAFALVMVTGSPDVFGQPAPGTRDEDEANRRAQRQQEVQQVLGDKAGYAAAIVARWEESAREAGRWDKSYSIDLLESLMKLDAENLLAAGKASSYQAMMTWIVDTRIADAGALAGGVTRLFDVDSSSLTAQGGSAPVAESPWAWRKRSR
jgi:hypothetical protein